MKRTLTLAVGLSLLSTGAFAAAPKPSTPPATQKPAAEAPAKPGTKAKHSKEHAAHTKAATTPTKDTGATH